MTKHELERYILSRKYHCIWCLQLQARVAALGVSEIHNWDGMICGGVEDMQIRLAEIETGVKHEPLDFNEFFTPEPIDTSSPVQFCSCDLPSCKYCGVI